MIRMSEATLALAILILAIPLPAYRCARRQAVVRANRTVPPQLPDAMHAARAMPGMRDAAMSMPGMPTPCRADAPTSPVEP